MWEEEGEPAKSRENQSCQNELAYSGKYWISGEYAQPLQKAPTQFLLINTTINVFLTNCVDFHV